MRKTSFIITLLTSVMTFAQLTTPSGTVSITTNPTSTNVGIGTFTPTQKLDVYGNVKVTNGFFMTGFSTFGADQGGAITLKSANLVTSPYLNFFNSDESQFARFEFKGNSLSLIGSKLNMDNRGIEFTHSTWGSGFGAKIYGSDDSGSTSMRIAVRANNAVFTDAMVIKTTGNIGIGSSLPTEKLEVIGNVKISNKVIIGSNNFPINTNYSNYKLFVQGGILTDEVRVVSSSGGTWPDYVFEKEFKLKPLSEVENYIIKYKHLPNVPSVKQVMNEGINITEMIKIQQEKIEELMLYIIDQNKRIEKLEKITKKK